MNVMHRALALIYPDQCVLCTNLVDGRRALCATCWRDTPFLNGHVCDKCGSALVGYGDGLADHCDDCINLPRPWVRGRAAFAYRDAGRRLVLALKHGDRTDLVPSAARWMAEAGADVLKDAPLLVPIPIFWTRLIRRKYNQAAELAYGVGRHCQLEVCPDALRRTRATKVQDGMSVAKRFANVDGAICANPARASSLEGRNICLIDDVMTSGATLAVATQACHDAGANHVSVLVLARVAKAP